MTLLPAGKARRMKEDAELVELAVGGDSAAFSDLYERYFDNVYDFLARMVKDRDEAADLAQDTFLRAMNSLSSLSKGGSFKSWLFTIARNTALNRLERSSRTQPLWLDDQTDQGDGSEMQVVDPDRFSNPEEAAEANDYAGLVWEAASSLDARQYSALHYSVRLGFDNEELAEVLGVTRNNAYQIVNRTKAALESAIGALVLLRQGRRFCKELDTALASLAVGEMTPDVKRLIDRHSARCDTCSERRRKLASPFAVFAGLAFLQPATGVKAAVLENLQAGFAQTYGGGGGQSSAGMPTSETVSPVAGGAGGGAGAASTALGGASDDDGGFMSGKWKFAAIGAGAAAVLLMLGGVAWSAGVLGDSEVKSAVVESPTPTATVVALAQSATETPTTTATSTPAPTETPEPQNSQAEPTEPPLQSPPTATNTPVPPTATSTATATATPTQTPTPSPTPCLVTMFANPEVLDYGTQTSSLQLVIGVANCDLDIEYQLIPSEAWIVPVPDDGTIETEEEVQITVRILRNQLSAGKHQGQITIQSVVGTLTVQVLVQVPGQTPGGLRTP
jgi:RNA polymerase sigma factor (sigma-70 family)